MPGGVGQGPARRAAKRGSRSHDGVLLPGKGVPTCGAVTFPHSSEPEEDLLPLP